MTVGSNNSCGPAVVEFEQSAKHWELRGQGTIYGLFEAVLSRTTGSARGQGADRAWCGGAACQRTAIPRHRARPHAARGEAAVSLASDRPGSRAGSCEGAVLPSTRRWIGRRWSCPAPASRVSGDVDHVAAFDRGCRTGGIPRRGVRSAGLQPPRAADGRRGLSLVRARGGRLRGRERRRVRALSSRRARLGGHRRVGGGGGRTASGSARTRRCRSHTRAPFAWRTRAKVRRPTSGSSACPAFPRRCSPRAVSHRCEMRCTSRCRRTRSTSHWLIQERPNEVVGAVMGHLSALEW